MDPVWIPDDPENGEGYLPFNDVAAYNRNDAGTYPLGRTNHTQEESNITMPTALGKSTQRGVVVSTISAQNTLETQICLAAIPILAAILLLAWRMYGRSILLFFLEDAERQCRDLPKQNYSGDDTYNDETDRSVEGHESEGSGFFTTATVEDIEAEGHHRGTTTIDSETTSTCDQLAVHHTVAYERRTFRMLPD